MAITGESTWRWQIQQSCNDIMPNNSSNGMQTYMNIQTNEIHFISILTAKLLVANVNKILGQFHLHIFYQVSENLSF